MYNQVIVVGGGLSGLSAAHTVLERGGNVLVLDKNSFFGGNSTKARLEKFKLDLSLVSRLGGHSQPRTHRGEEMFPGMTITYALMESIEEIYRPDIYNLPTTNSEGDGHKMVIAIGGKATHMEKVQVHPTGLVDLKCLMQKSNFWPLKHFGGVGGLLLNGEGKRFCDELSHSDYVTSEIWKTKVPVRLVLNTLAKEIGNSASQLKATFDDYNDIASNKKKDPFGKKFFHNVPITINDQFHVALKNNFKN
ncbi:succinate dehydrogenase/fumarate reductase flavo protein [Gigaspora rosea]|uniref:Succinate dehydrogenase/fumarate reductase flavo protein n=1 Tax=Gigaspora rosea TaxID=44941 RepID=A0A397VYI8_9GLOM|nr:succinate dehydrogenase/fumarate reductase flavo protein [Gigaspora rosea]